MAKAFHDEMAPKTPMLGEEVSDLRSEFRVDFINKSILTAYELSGMFCDDS